jgi:opacity protein-like surface antigen
MKNILKILLLVVLLQSNQDLYASEKNSYIRVDFGMPYYNKLSEDYDKVRLHGGQLYNVGLGYKFNNNFRTDLTISKLNNAKFFYSNKNSQSRSDTESKFSYENDVVSKSKFNVDSTVIMANLYYDLLNYKIFNVYTGLGIGMSQNSVTGFMYNDGMDLNQGYKKYNDSNKNNSFAYGLTLGSSLKISDSSVIDLNYKYYDLGKIKHKADEIESLSYNMESKHKVHVISFGLRVFM